MSADPHYWLGRLSMALALSLKRTDRREDLRAVLQEFVRQPGEVPSGELRRLLREEMR